MLLQRVRPKAGMISCIGATLGLTMSAASPTNEFIPEPPPLPLWDYSVNARAAVGYKDNLLLNRDATESSYLLASALDLTVLRLPLDGRQFHFILSGEDIRYPDGNTVQKEQTLIALAQGKLDLGRGFQGGLTAQYLYLDQVVDVSITETATAPMPLRGHLLALRPSCRVGLPGRFWVEAEGIAQRQWFAAPLDDYREGGPKLTVGRDYGHRSTATLGYQWALRAYDHRAPLAADGTPLAGTLQFQRHEVELVLRHNWDARRRWRTVTRLNCQVNRDNGAGYFDHNRFQVSQQVRYVAGPWELRCQARLSHFEFAVQRAGSADPSLREKTLAAIGLRGQKKLTKHLNAFADYEYEQSLSNRTVDEYRVHKASGGLELEF